MNSVSTPFQVSLTSYFSSSLSCVSLAACITGKLGVSFLRSLPFVLLDPEDVGREGVDALDKFLASRQTRKALLCLPQ